MRWLIVSVLLPWLAAATPCQPIDEGIVLRPITALVVIPHATEVSESFLAQVERASLRGDWSRLQNVALENRFLFHKVSDRCVVLFPSEFATRSTARAQRMIDWLNGEKPFRLNTLDSFQLKEVDAMLRHISKRTMILGIVSAIQNGNQLYLQRAATLYAEVKLPNATLHLPLSELEPLIPLPTKEDEYNSSQGAASLPTSPSVTEEDTPEWRVLVYGDFGGVSVQSELIAQAFGIISEAAKRDEQNAQQLYEAWKLQLQAQYLSEQDLSADWQKWTALSDAWKEKVYSALLGAHLNETEVLDASTLNRLIAEGRIDVRFQVGGGLQILKVSPQGTAELLLVSLGDVGGVTIYDPYPPRPAEE